MKNHLLLGVVLLLRIADCRAEEAPPIEKIAQSLRVLIPHRPLDYRLVILHMPMSTSVEQISEGSSFKAFAPYQVIISPTVWEKQIKELLDILTKTHVQKTDLIGDFRWGIEIVAPWDQKPLAIYLDAGRNLAEINGIRYQTKGQLSEWIARYAVPVMTSMQDPK